LSTLEKNKQESEAQAQKMIEAQGQQNAQNEQLKAQNQMALDTNVSKGKMEEEIVRGKVKANQTKLEGNLALLEAARLAMEAEQGLTVNTGGK